MKVEYELLKVELIIPNWFGSHITNSRKDRRGKRTLTYTVDEIYPARLDYK